MKFDSISGSGTVAAISLATASLYISYIFIRNECREIIQRK